MIARILDFELLRARLVFGPPAASPGTLVPTCDFRIVAAGWSGCEATSLSMDNSLLPRLVALLFRWMRALPPFFLR